MSDIKMVMAKFIPVHAVFSLILERPFLETLQEV